MKTLKHFFCDHIFQPNDENFETGTCEKCGKVERLGHIS